MTMQRVHAKELAKNFSYSLAANIISMLLGIVAILFIPKYIGIAAYGYYQLYILYTSYVVITALGLGDGNYLSIGGEHYAQIDYQSQNSKFWFLVISQSILFSLLAIIVLTAELGPDDKIVLGCTALCAVIIHARYYLYLTLQATNRIIEYSVIIVTERVFSIILSICAILFGYHGYVLLILFDIIGRLLSLLIAICYCKDIVFRAPRLNKAAFRAIKDNMSSGLMILITTLSSTFILGITRQGIETHWDIETFAKVSLTISISNIALRCINSFSIVMFPALRRTDEKRLPKIYENVNTGLIMLILSGLIFYQPTELILKAWLPQYADSLRYAAILLPICIYECKNSLLVSTYFKTIHKEKSLFAINSIALIFSLLITWITVSIMSSIEAAIVSMLIALALRCILGEWLLGKYLCFAINKKWLIEILMVASFVVCNWFLGVIGIGVYLAVYLLFLYIQRDYVKKLLNKRRYWGQEKSSDSAGMSRFNIL